MKKQIFSLVILLVIVWGCSNAFAEAEGKGKGGGAGRRKYTENMG